MMHSDCCDLAVCTAKEVIRYYEIAQTINLSLKRSPRVELTRMERASAGRESSLATPLGVKQCLYHIEMRSMPRSATTKLLWSHRIRILTRAPLPNNIAGRSRTSEIRNYKGSQLYSWPFEWVASQRKADARRRWLAANNHP